MTEPVPAHAGVPAAELLAPRVDLPLTAEEAAYVAAARAPNTRRGYASDWREFSSWCARHGHTPLPAAPEALSGYITELAGAGARVGTISRRLSSIRFVHVMRDLPDPGDARRVATVWEGIRRTHGAPPVQARALMPPDLDDVVDACPATRTFTTRPAEGDLAGLRDRALLLVGFFSALRRSELAALTVADVADHPRGRVLSIPRSKTNPYGTEPELVVLPHTARAARCPVTALTAWLDAAGITEGPVLRRVTRGNRVADGPLHPESVNAIVQRAVARADIGPGPWSAHSLRAGHVTYAHQRGASDRAIAHQTRHRSLATIGTYVRIDDAWEDNSAALLAGL
ncbi:site-specific integrase [Pseudonocardia spirodelae]|uniref:Site-specific integrase n=1 Tax=Pseudonocardia spirodelae TaxID=3133431 RepID=A0ABU8TCF6_9PSEU